MNNNRGDNSYYKTVELNLWDTETNIVTNIDDLEDNKEKILP